MIDDPKGITLKGLLPGYYELVETKSPSGYNMEMGRIHFSIANDGTVTYTENNSMVQYTQRTENQEDEFKIGNTAGAALPATGGRGTRGIYTTGIILLSFVAFGLLLHRRKMAEAQYYDKNGY